MPSVESPAKPDRVESEARTRPPSRVAVGLASVGCAAAVLIAFSPALGNHFVNLDDDTYIVQNRRILVGLSPEAVLWAAGATHASNWHPLTWVSLQLDASLYGLDAWGYHLTNLLLHAASSALLLGALAVATGTLRPSALAAALFALHPLRAESVVWAAERKDVLAGLFFALTLWAYLSYAARPSPGRYGVVALALALGLAAKPMLVSVPFVLLLLDFWPLGRARTGRPRDAATRPWRQTDLSAPWTKLIAEKLPLFALAALSAGATLEAQYQGGAVRDTGRLPAEARVANAAVAYWRYVGKEVWPANLTVFYPYPSRPWSRAQVLTAAAGLAAVCAAAWLLRGRWPYLLVGWLWFLGMLLPVIGLVQVGDQSLADRYSYLPSIGLTLAAAWALRDLGRRVGVPVVIAASVAGAAVAACAAVTWVQAHYWRDGITLWQHALAVVEDNATARYSLGHALRRAGRVEDAVDQYRKALEFNPTDAGAHNNLGFALLLLSRPNEAAHHLEIALRINPSRANAWHNLGRAREAQGRRPDAALAFEKAADLYETAGDSEAARFAARAALRLLPDQSADPEVQRARQRLGRFEGEAR